MTADFPERVDDGSIRRCDVLSQRLSFQMNRIANARGRVRSAARGANVDAAMTRVAGRGAPEQLVNPPRRYGNQRECFWVSEFMSHVAASA
jgi:hypothetical protein